VSKYAKAAIKNCVRSSSHTGEQIECTGILEIVILYLKSFIKTKATRTYRKRLLR